MVGDYNITDFQLWEAAVQYFGNPHCMFSEVLFQLCPFLCLMKGGTGSILQRKCFKPDIRIFN